MSSREADGMRNHTVTLHLTRIRREIRGSSTRHVWN
jgi:hypothetical protein